MADFLAALQQLSGTARWLVLGGCSVVALGALFYFVRNQRRLRSMTDTPTARIRSAAQGFTELEGCGHMLDGEPVIAPLTGQRCLWWEFSIEEKQQRYSNKRRVTDWVTVQRDRSTAIFALNDGTDQCIVDPEGAQVISTDNQTWYGDSAWPRSGPKGGSWGLFASYRYHQRLLAINTSLYAQGLFRTQRGAGRFDQNEELTALLGEWKRDQASLLKNFDVNQDGRIDLQEWEAARRVALMRIQRQQSEQDSHPGLHVLARPDGKRPFILSAIAQSKLIRHYRWWSLACIAAFLPAASIAGLLLL